MSSLHDTGLLHRYWGKARRADAGDFSWHPLAYHCLDAAAAADAWWRLDAPLRASMARACRTEEERLRPWLLFFCALHDFGKWDARFQLKVPELADRLQPELKAKPDHDYDHGQKGYAAFAHEFGGLPDAAYDWMRQVAGHHGSIPWDGEWRAPIASPETKKGDREARKVWFDALTALFLTPAAARLEDLPAAPPHLAGFCCVADWLASNEDFFPHVRDRSGLPEFFASRSQAAEKCLNENGLVRACAGAGGMARLYPELSPRGVQVSVETWPAKPGLTLIEAPTGTGKTEAALAYASRLLSAGLADGVIFALPTQATANAMLGRIEEVAGRIFEGGANVVLAHGRAKYNEEFMRLQKTRPTTAQGTEDASAQCSRWLAASRKKVFLGQIGVCTIDQVLLSVLPIRHGFVRGFGLCKSVLVVDEIHAYDSYMNGLLDAVLKRQREAGGSAVLLSATLDARRRRQLLRLWDDAGTDASESALVPYPLVSHASGGVSRAWTAASDGAPRRIALEAVASAAMKVSDDVLGRLASAARQGARAVLVCNLVAEAQDAGERLLRMGAPVDVFHSRFRLCDRQELETRILKDYGKGPRENAGRILVATQVVEQSLDLDFDWMVTQLCPADLLFQRLGRLHRHERSRPLGFRAPHCLVILPASLEFGGHKFVYANARALWRTQKLIERRGEAVFPAAYREWIEAVYAEEAWPDEPGEIAALFAEFEDEESARRSCAKNMLSDGTTPFGDTDGNVTALTRDGEMSAAVLPLEFSGGCPRFLDGDAFSSDDADFEENVDRNSVPTPRWWAENLPEDDEKRRRLNLKKSSADSWEGVVGKVQWRYDKRLGLQRRKT